MSLLKFTGDGLGHYMFGLINRMRRHSFVNGLLIGSVATVLCWLLFLCVAGLTAWLDFSPGESSRNGIVSAFTFVTNNLGGSLLAFALVSIAYGYYLWQLKKGLSSQTLTFLEVRKFTVKLQALSSLFFGIGVLWTAIGMRSALLVALGDLDADSAAMLGAFEILKRLVDGGILIALSTTIVGGFGGYLMKLIETFAVAADIQALAAAEDDRKNNDVLSLLGAIEANTFKSDNFETLTTELVSVKRAD